MKYFSRSCSSEMYFALCNKINSILLQDRNISSRNTFSSIESLNNIEYYRFSFKSFWYLNIIHYLNFFSVQISCAIYFLNLNFIYLFCILAIFSCNSKILYPLFIFYYLYYPLKLFYSYLFCFYFIRLVFFCNILYFQRNLFDSTSVIRFDFPGIVVYFVYLYSLRLDDRMFIFFTLLFWILISCYYFYHALSIIAGTISK